MDTGLIHIYCGDGKGKTTAALGLAIRCAGHGGRVLFAQFLKETALHGLGSSQFIRGHLEGEFLTAFAAQYGDGRDAR